MAPLRRRMAITPPAIKIKNIMSCAADRPFGMACRKYQGVIEGVVNGMGTTSDASGQGLRQMQTGKVQQYAAILFAGAALLAGVFVILISL